MKLCIWQDCSFHASVQIANIFIIFVNESIKSFAKSIVLIRKPNLLGLSPFYVLTRINLQN
jgi:hypothetical protein